MRRSPVHTEPLPEPRSAARPRRRIAVVVVLLLAVVVASSRAAGWWPATHRAPVSAPQGGAWPFPAATAQLVCRVPWFGRPPALSVVVGRDEYALNDRAENRGLRSVADVFVRRIDPARRVPYLNEVNGLVLDARALCAR